jgi:D-alanyl-lipoteichoic acid acyltransferase DltB (MBOAT superfamily)
LTSWFRDYIYFPLGGSRGGRWKTIRNTFIIFLVSGLWHGANWTFVCWGFLNALYFLPMLLVNRKSRKTETAAQGKLFPSIREIVSIGATFVLTTLAWIFFRAENIHQAGNILSRVFSRSFLTIPEVMPPLTILLIIYFLVIEWFGREDDYAIAKYGLKWKSSIRLLFYLGLSVLVFVFFGEQTKFIYFQF